jgi:hypothetical protein
VDSGVETTAVAGANDVEPYDVHAYGSWRVADTAAGSAALSPTSIR